MRMSHFVSCSPDNPGVKAGVAKESTATTNSKRRRHLQDGGRGIGELIVTATEALPHNAEHTEGGFPCGYTYTPGTCATVRPSGPGLKPNPPPPEREPEPDTCSVVQPRR